MSEAAERLRKVMIERALHGAGAADGEARRAAFDGASGGPAAALLDKVATAAWEIEDADVDAARRAGVPEDAIFELVVCAALGAASRQLDAARAALDEAEATP